jgi:hypothetical protein
MAFATGSLEIRPRTTMHLNRLSSTTGTLVKPTTPSLPSPPPLPPQSNARHQTTPKHQHAGRGRRRRRRRSLPLHPPRPAGRLHLQVLGDPAGRGRAGRAARGGGLHGRGRRPVLPRAGPPAGPRQRAAGRRHPGHLFRPAGVGRRPGRAGSAAEGRVGRGAGHAPRDCAVLRVPQRGAGYMHQPEGGRGQDQGGHHWRGHGERLGRGERRHHWRGHCSVQSTNRMKHKALLAPCPPHPHHAARCRWSCLFRGTQPSWAAWTPSTAATAAASRQPPGLSPQPAAAAFPRRRPCRPQQQQQQQQ